MLPYQI